MKQKSRRQLKAAKKRIENQERRLGLLEAGYDFIRVVEVNGRSDMGVCLVAENLSVIGCEPPL